MTWRPAKMGRDPRYAETDPGHEYIEGVTQTWLGPLAERWEIAGQKATLDQRNLLYQGLSPLTKEPLLPHVKPETYRPVHGGSLHASQSLDAWLCGLKEPEKRKQAEKVFMECAAETVKETVLKEAYGRTGHAGKDRVPVETLGVVFKHTLSSDGKYHLHAHVERHNIGRDPSGKLRAVDNHEAFGHQTAYTTVFHDKLIEAFHRQLNVPLRVTPEGRLEVLGVDVRGVKTERQEKIDQELERKGLPRTPKTLHWAAQNTHRDRTGDEKTTTEEAAQKTRAWYEGRGVNLGAIFEKVREWGSEYAQEKRAGKAVAAAVALIEGTGIPVSDTVFRVNALHEARTLNVNTDYAEAFITKVLAKPERAGLVRLESGLLSTPAVEAARGGWGREFTRLEKKRPSPPSEKAFARTRVEGDRPRLEDIEAGRKLTEKRAVRIDRPSAAAREAIAAYRASGRRVHAVAGDLSAREVRALTGTGVQHPDAFAARVGKTGAWEVFLEVRRHRWKSVGHGLELMAKARRPKLELTTRDVLVIDVRSAGHHVTKAALTAARKAKATVVLISPEPVVTQRDRGPSQEKSQGPER